MIQKKQTLNIDITDLYRTKGRTGIQRVVREIALRWIDDNKNLKLRLLRFNPKTHDYEVFANQNTKNFLLSKSDTMKVKETIQISSLGSGDIFFDLDSSWNVPLKRSYLYKELKKQNVYIATMVYDLIPLKLPQYTHINTLRNFLLFISAVYANSDLVICDSRSTEKDFNTYKTKLKITRNIPTLVTKLGADFIKSKRAISSTAQPSKQSPEFIKDKYILFVGTIEPRKCHSLVIDAFNKIQQTNPDIHLVFAGKEGWNSRGVMSKLKKHHLFGKKLHWIDSPPDDELERLYEHCFMSMYVSSYEGFGLPIIEALNHSKVTIASRNSSMYEAGKNFADYTYFNTANEIAEIALAYLNDDNLYKTRIKYIKQNFKPYTWDGVYNTIHQALSGLDQAEVIKDNNKKKRQQKLQFVFISNAPDKLARNIALIDERIKFVKNYIIVAPADNIDSINQIESAHQIIHFNDEQILGNLISDFKKADHVLKNWMLRSQLIQLDELDDEFIMLDDDNQPLKDIDISTFINTDGTYNAYYFYDILKWPHHGTSYDKGVQHMKPLLDTHNLELLQYSSHQPQIINKTIFKDAIKLLAPEPNQAPGDEWSTYFNYAITRYPTLFQKRVFEAMNWPARPTDWQHEYSPAKYKFENYYDHLYLDEREIFYNLPQPDASKKIKIKTEQLKPYKRAIQKYNSSLNLISKLDAAHGIIEFKYNQTTVLISGIPYFITTTPKACLRIIGSFQVINDGVLLDDIKLCCEIRGVSTSQCNLKAAKKSDGYYTGLFSLPVTSNGPGVYIIDFFIRVNGMPVYGNTRGIARLLVL